MAIIILLQFVFFLLKCSSPVFANPEGDALFALKKAVRDPKNVLASWDTTLTNPCIWFHVTCDSDNRVTHLDLGNENLSGKLVPELSRLERLQYLELYRNNFEGEIPKEIGNLKSLISLDLNNNKLTGPIPSSLANLYNLKFLRLNDNRLTGAVPPGILKLPHLLVLNVSNNHPRY